MSYTVSSLCSEILKDSWVWKVVNLRRQAGRQSGGGTRDKICYSLFYYLLLKSCSHIIWMEGKDHTLMLLLSVNPMKPGIWNLELLAVIWEKLCRWAESYVCYLSVFQSLDVLCCAKSIESCLTLCNPMECSLPGSSVHGILQAGILGWVAISFSRESSQLRDQTCISYSFCIGRWVLYFLHNFGWPKIR